MTESDELNSFWRCCGVLSGRISNVLNKCRIVPLLKKRPAWAKVNGRKFPLVEYKECPGVYLNPSRIKVPDLAPKDGAAIWWGGYSFASGCACLNPTGWDGLRACGNLTDNAPIAW